ncbi:hypothetical protein D9M71_793730 [compost metagenome]
MLATGVARVGGGICAVFHLRLRTGSQQQGNGQGDGVTLERRGFRHERAYWTVDR